MLENVDDGNDVRVGSKALLLCLGNKRPELVDVDDRAPVRVVGQVEVAHTNLTEVTGMVLVEVGTIKLSVCLSSRMEDKECAPVMVLTTGETTTSGMLAVLADTTVTGRDVSAVLAGVGETGRHGCLGARFSARVPKPKTASSARPSNDPAHSSNPFRPISLLDHSYGRTDGHGSVVGQQDGVLTLMSGGVDLASSRFGKCGRRASRAHVRVLTVPRWRFSSALSFL